MLNRIKGFSFGLACCVYNEDAFCKEVDSLIATVKELDLGIDVVRVLMDEASYQEDICFEVSNKKHLGQRYRTMGNLLFDRYVKD